MSTTTSTRLAGAAGASGAALLSGVIAVLTLTQNAHMTSLGWHPLTAPTMDWPSGLALGPFGAIMTTTFVISGAMLVLFAHGLGAWLPSSVARFGFTLAGIGMAALAFETDPTLTTKVATWHGRLHDIAYMVLGAGLALGLAVSAIVLTRTQAALAALSALTVVMAVLGFAVKGLLFYGMYATVMAWILIIGLSMRRSQQ